MSVYVLGATTFDLLVTDLPRWPTSDAALDEFTARSLVEIDTAPISTVGGNGGNAASALARLGCQVHLLTALGSDPLGMTARGWLAETGCEVTLLPPDETSVNVVATSRAGQRVSMFHPVAIDTAAALAQGDDLVFNPGDHLLLAGFPHAADEVLVRWAAAAHGAGSTVWLDIGPALAGFTHKRLAPLLPHLDVLLGNRDELASVNGGADPERVEVELAARLNDGVVIKAGAGGAAFRDRSNRVAVPAWPVTATASVGAGDVFNAGLIRARVAGIAAPTDQLRFANAAAALMLERGRGALGAPTYDEVAVFLSRNTRHDGGSTS